MRIRNRSVLLHSCPSWRSWVRTMMIPFCPHNFWRILSFSFSVAVPTQQYRNLFGSNNNINSKSHSPAKSTSSTSSKSKSQSPRKSKSAGETSKKQKAATASGPTKPKTLEQALKQITPDDLAAQVAQVKISCPGSELRWLSSVSRNQKVEGERKEIWDRREREFLDKRERILRYERRDRERRADLRQQRVAK